MEKKKLIVTVSGECNSGKSRLSFMLKKFLRENDFDVDFDGGIDYEDETQFDKYMSKNIDQSIQHIKETRKVYLKEIQINN